ncbi:hypothetical protein Dsin_028513 [Dipteronia sinensis]|uniref:PPIase cyclophilin-type domain-containing protein n=1 Tax=Dipteronia sinensis TaxID=43782 RepID=A0AAE0DVM1_9ROSI|nr:hypothetical protein Dsin_028513 [Dipteronia sinensis]
MQVRVLPDDQGIGRNEKPLHYKGTIFHRVNPRSLSIGRDLTEGNRLGGESIYSGSFADENFVNKHTVQESSIWPIPAQTPTTPNFSFVMQRPSGSMGPTLSSVRPSRDLMS